jgi:hypothetical protein
MHDVAMRLLFVGVIPAGGALAAPAQERQVGAKVGPSLGVVAFEPEQGERYGQRIGAAGGGFVVLPAGRHLAAQSEALFNRKGAKLDDPDTEATATILIDYLDFPFLMRMNGPRSGTTAFHVFGGPYLGIRTGARRQVAFAFSGLQPHPRVDRMAAADMVRLKADTTTVQVCLKADTTTGRRLPAPVSGGRGPAADIAHRPAGGRTHRDRACRGGRGRSRTSPDRQDPAGAALT